MFTLIRTVILVGVDGALVIVSIQPRAMSLWSDSVKVVVRLIIKCGFYCVLNYTKPQKVVVRLLLGVRLIHGIIRYITET